MRAGQESAKKAIGFIEVCSKCNVGYVLKFFIEKFHDYRAVVQLAEHGKSLASLVYLNEVAYWSMNCRR